MQPQYTADAMRAKVQGVVVLECIVLPDGTVSEARVKRSLPFGLDEEAIKAARQWRFAPGTRQGEPVAVIISIEWSFSLRKPRPRALTTPLRPLKKPKAR